MPVTAQMVDDLRQWLGAERVDAALVAGQQARRKVLALQAEHGEAHAQAWLRRQQFPQGCFWAEEGGVEIGVRRP